MRKANKAAIENAEHSGPLINVTAQQSRFHTDAVDVHTSNEINVKDLSINIGQREILSHAELHLQPGGHYVLVGRNGTGKSTLLKAIAEGRVPGIPWSLRVLLLGQTRMDEPVFPEDKERTVLDHVLHSDRKREQLLNESRVLSASLDEASSSASIHAYRKVMHDRLLEKVNETRLIATRRSGARGAKVRKELIALEEKLVQSEARLAEDVEQLTPAKLSEETQAAVELLASIQASIEQTDATAAEAKTRIILKGLGFSQESIESPMSNLSGGWKTRCDIACALCQQADVLLLDEPTNFLDLPSILWLQSYVEGLTDTTVVLVTHDRDFADYIGEHLLVLRNQQLEPFKGNLSTYENERYKKAKWMTKMKEAQEKQKAHMQSTIANNIRAAKKSGDDNKLKQAASRQKKLDDRMGLQVSAKGGRFKLNRDLAGYHLKARDEIEVPDFDLPVHLVFPSVPSDLRFPGALVNLENISFQYPKAGKPTLREVNLTIHPGQRIGIVGLNGAGKSTLISLICGTEVLKPGSGTITRHPRVRIGHYSQQAVEDLTAVANKDPSLTALSHVMSVHSELSEQGARALLSGLGLPHPLASTVPLAHLSGGQKVRLALALVLGASPPHLLVLDEITTHLDSDTVTALAVALKKYEGCVLVVSHDRWFVRVVVEGEGAYIRRGWDDENQNEEDDQSSDEEDLADKGVVFRLFSGRLKVLEAGMNQYEEIAARASSKLSSR